MQTAATNSRKVRTFRGGEYVANLMAELSRAGIHERIQQARVEAGLSQEELADLLKTHTRSVQNWESKTPSKPGKKLIVPWDRLDEIATATGRSKHWLLHGREELEGGSEQLSSLVLRLEAVSEKVDRLDGATSLAFRSLEEAIARLAAELRPPSQEADEG